MWSEARRAGLLAEAAQAVLQGLGGQKRRKKNQKAGTRKTGLGKIPNNLASSSGDEQMEWPSRF